MSDPLSYKMPKQDILRKGMSKKNEADDIMQHTISKCIEVI